MAEYRSSRRSRRKTFHGQYRTIDPGRGLTSGLDSGRSSRSRSSRSRRSHDQYVAPRSHTRRGGRGPRRRLTGKQVLARFILLLIVLAVAAGAVFLLTRPASATITALPEDATITFASSTVATGTLSVEDLDPGPYSITIERRGYEPLTVTEELKRGRRTKLAYELVPQPQTISVVTHPEGAAVTVTLADGQVLSGVTPFEQQTLSGPVTLTLALDGYNPYTREFFLDAPVTMDYFMDPEGQILHGLGTITTKGAPKGVSVTPDGSEAWTSILNGPPSIQIFDPLTGESIGEVDIGEHGAVEVIFNKAGTLAYTSQMETAKCFEIDVKTRKVLREFDTESAWTKWVTLSPDEKTLYASNWSGDDVSEIDLATGTLVRRMRVSNTPRGMYATADGKYLFVAGFDSGYLDRIDLATGETTAVFKDGVALRHIVGDERTGRLFISDMAKDVIWVHDIASATTTLWVETDEKPNTIDLSPDGKMLFVSCRGENNPVSYYVPGPEWGSILVFDTSNGEPLDALIGGNQPTALDVSDDGRILMFSDFLDNRLRVYEIPPYETFAAGGGGRYEAHFAEIAK
jgi:DNA-binding beta-propeller fold protein YncE